MEWKEEEILILVKAYPNPSNILGESVCSAGITRSGKWIRIYPVPFRDLPTHQQFEKFQWIRAKVAPAREKLNRPESHKIDPSSILLLEKIPAGKSWGERERLILPHISRSLEELWDMQKSRNVSLGAFKPKAVRDFLSVRGESEWTEVQMGVLGRTSLFNQSRTVLEKIPYKFVYKFSCNDERCGENGHEICIIDWEVNESYRRWKNIYPDEKTTLQKHKEKWLDHFLYNGSRILL